MSDEDLVEAAEAELQALRDEVEQRVAEVEQARRRLDELVESRHLGVIMFDSEGKVLASAGATPAEIQHVVAQTVVCETLETPIATTIEVRGWRLEFHPIPTDPDAVGVLLMTAEAQAVNL